jgi:hypothetical protein
MAFSEVSASNDINVEAAFQYVAERIYSKIE